MECIEKEKAKPKPTHVGLQRKRIDAVTVRTNKPQMRAANMAVKAHLPPVICLQKICLHMRQVQLQGRSNGACTQRIHLKTLLQNHQAEYGANALHRQHIAKQAHNSICSVNQFICQQVRMETGVYGMFINTCCAGLCNKSMSASLAHFQQQTQALVRGDSAVK